MIILVLFSPAVCITMIILVLFSPAVCITMIILVLFSPAVCITMIILVLFSHKTFTHAYVLLTPPNLIKEPELYITYHNNS